MNAWYSPLLVTVLTGLCLAQATQRQAVLLDTDLGESLDDAVALALLLASPEVELRGVTTTGNDAQAAAGIICQFLENIGRQQIPVAAAHTAQNRLRMDGAFQFALRARQTQPVKQSAVQFLHEQLQREPCTLVAIGPLTNVAALLREHPEAARRISRLVIMGGALNKGYNGQPPAEPEYNFRSDVAAVREVLASGVPILLVPLDASATLRLEGERLDKLLKCESPLCRQVQALYELGDLQPPVLYDPAAVALALEEGLFETARLRIAIDEQGISRPVEGMANARVATNVRREALLDWCVDRLTRSTTEQPRPSQRAPISSAPIQRGGFPARVHVFEDYETDIERRWWLAGKLETRNTPPGSTRACRGVLCRDFDRRMGDPLATYRAVIFNPVPGPPMGPRTRLGFRYWLRGTDKLRVQIFSLSNGYHRQLVLDGLPQGQWQHATVDMTAARRPDGSGGALAADERIDDIQFYVDPDAELLIDDIVLYDASDTAAGVFPRRFLFTGWFDTGRQGVEWPGTFEIVPHESPQTWKCAQAASVSDENGRQIEIHLRGPRPLRDSLMLKFRYRLTGAESMQLEIVSPGDPPRRASQTLNGIRPGAWADASLDWSRQSTDLGETVDRLIFRVPTAAQLQVDDVLLYEPGEP